MEIVLNDSNNIPLIINFEKNVIFFGQDNQYKIDFIKKLVDGLHKNKIIIDGKKIDVNDYNIIYIDEQNDFSDEFKFTKNNSLKQIIYNDTINKINEEKLINYTNEIFDVIDERINNLLDRKINKKIDNNISFQIEIPDINSVIDKFTNIYIDDVLLNSDRISKSMKRKLLYEIYFWEIERNKDKNNIIIINNFDAYLSINEIINIMIKIERLTSNNCHFILTTCGNIFEYIPLDIFSVYKINNKLINFNAIDVAIKNHLIRNEYNLSEYNGTFDEYYLENESLIIDNDINEFRTKILNKYPHLISKVLNCTTIKVVDSKPKNIRSEYIICEDKFLQQLFLEISSKFID